MSYVTPTGGYTRLITPEIAAHGVAFWNGHLPLGSNSVAVKLDAPGNPIVVANPVPFGPKSTELLNHLVGEGETPNVKYLISLDAKHFLAIKTWKDEFPDAKVIGGEIVSTKESGVKFDYIFTPENPTAESINLPREFTAEFDSIFFTKGTQEIALFHKKTATIITADLFVNLPATSAFKDYISKNGAGYGLFRFIQGFLFGTLGLFGIQGRIGTKFTRGLVGDETDQINRLLELPAQRILMAHGEFIDKDATKHIQELLAPLVKKQT